MTQLQNAQLQQQLNAQIHSFHKQLPSIASQLDRDLFTSNDKTVTSSPVSNTSPVQPNTHFAQYLHVQAQQVDMPPVKDVVKQKGFFINRISKIN